MKKSLFFFTILSIISCQKGDTSDFFQNIETMTSLDTTCRQIDTTLYNFIVMGKCHQDSLWNAFKIDSALIGEWDWQYAYCGRGYYFDGEYFKGVSIEFRPNHTLFLKKDGKTFQFTTWSVDEKQYNNSVSNFRISTDGYAFSNGWIQFCNNTVGFMSAGWDGCDDFFKQKCKEDIVNLLPSCNSDSISILYNNQSPSMKEKFQLYAFIETDRNSPQDLLSIHFRLQDGAYQHISQFTEALGFLSLPFKLGNYNLEHKNILGNQYGVYTHILDRDILGNTYKLMKDSINHLLVLDINVEEKRIQGSFEAHFILKNESRDSYDFPREINFTKGDFCIKYYHY